MKKIFLIVMLGAIILPSCQKQSQPTGAYHNNDKAQAKENTDNEFMNSDEDFFKRHQQLGLKTEVELLQARATSAKYRDINRALADGYADIHVVMQNMGFHYMKSKLVDSVFDIQHPEILVYNKDEDGNLQLVAVEYAIPLNASVNAPEGFTGNSDVWDHNDDFGLWLLHAWVWQFNPAGVFNPTNPTVNVPM